MKPHEQDGGQTLYVQNTQQLQRTHLELIAALRRIDMVCRELSITYWVDSGTLLGSVRHSGFIPWDDDVDLCMLREDQERFVMCAPPLLGERYTVQTSRDDASIPAAQTKIYINGTHTRDTHPDGPTPRHDELFVDIFIMDRVSRFATVRRLDRILAWFVIQRPFAKSMAASSMSMSLKVRLGLRVLVHSPHWVIALFRQWIDWRSTRRDGALLGLDLAGLYGGFIYRHETIFPLGEGCFADLKVPIPCNTHAYLTSEFDSNYMDLPPLDERRSKHFCDISFDET